MKSRTIFINCILIALLLSAGHEYGQAKSDVEKGRLKIGIVSIWKILDDSRIVERYKQEILKDQQQARTTMEKLTKEVQANEAALKVLKTGSTDYMEYYKKILKDRAILQAEREFHENNMEFQTYKMTKNIYRDVLREAGEIAKDMDLDLVLESSEAYLEELNQRQFELTIMIHKLLYSNGCTDITDIVIERLGKAG